MLTPKYPPQDTAPPPVVVPAQTTAQAPAVQPHTSGVQPVPVAQRPTVQLTPGTAVALVGGGTAVVLVVGAVLVSMLLAVAITGASVAVCAVVLRSLLASETKRR